MDMYSAPLKASLMGLQLSGMIVEKQLRVMRVLGCATYESQLQFLGLAFDLPALGPVREQPVAKSRPPAKPKAKLAPRKTASKPAAKTTAKPVPKAAAKPAAKTAAKPTAKPAAKPAGKPAAKTAAKPAAKAAAKPAVARSSSTPATKPAPAKPVDTPRKSEPTTAATPDSQTASQAAAKVETSNVTAFPKPETGTESNSGAKRPRKPSAPPAMPERSASPDKAADS